MKAFSFSILFILFSAMLFANPKESIYLQAYNDNYISYAVVVESETASDYYQSGEDGIVVLLQDVMTSFAVYTICEEYALAINQIQTVDTVRIGCIINRINIDSLTFKIVGDNTYLAEWDILNLETNQQMMLYDEMEFSNLKNSEQQYMLVHSRKYNEPTDLQENSEIIIFDMYGNKVEKIDRGLYIIKENGKVKKILR